jgi:hypothetical protein
MIGRRFGTLTVQREADRVSSGAKMTRAWFCICDCGKERIVAGVELRRGHVKTCRVSPGLSLAPEYTAYHGMKARCLNKKNKEFKRYGAQEIKIAKRWLVGEGCKGGFACFPG